MVLSLETATLGGAVFLGRGAEQLAERQGDQSVSRSANLLTDIDDCLKEAGVLLQDVDIFACASGPGSFTGLRIGIATLKALAASLKKPCVGVPTLEAVAHAAGTSSATVALLPAGRGEVFAQMFSVSDDVVAALDTAAHLSPLRLVERYAEFEDLVWAGSGADAQRELLLKQARSGWRLAEPETNLARHVALLALQAFENGQLQSPEEISAIYVRPSDAELNQQCR